MRNWKIIASGAVAIAVLAGGVILSLGSKETEVSVSEEMKVPQGAAEVSTLPAPLDAPGKTDKPSEAAVLERPTLPFQNELEALSLIDDKVFTSDEEKEEFSRWTTNPDFVSALGERLKRPAFTLKEKKDQNLALSLVLKAERALALKTVESVVKDAQIEDENRPMEDRKQLAGVKAELIYQWTSMNPEDSQMIVGWLPGPVSQKIWLNVKHMQDSNVALSLEEGRRQAGR